MARKTHQLIIHCTEEAHTIVSDRAARLGIARQALLIAGFNRGFAEMVKDGSIENLRKRKL